MAGNRSYVTPFNGKALPTRSRGRCQCCRIYGQDGSAQGIFGQRVAAVTPSPIPTATPEPFCGDGSIDDGELCDDAADNGTDLSCCTEGCQFKPNGNASCDGNACTRPDSCSNGVCSPGPCADGLVCTFCGGTCADGGSGVCDCLP